MGTLKDALNTATDSRPGFRSKVDVWRETLDVEDREAFDVAVRDPEMRTSTIRRIVVAAGLEIGDAGFRSWREKARRRTS